MYEFRQTKLVLRKQFTYLLTLVYLFDLIKLLLVVATAAVAVVVGIDGLLHTDDENRDYRLQIREPEKKLLLLLWIFGLIPFQWEKFSR